jgi:hypothetical protein
MWNRWIGIACATCMLSANTALFLRDILPSLAAGDPPEPVALTLRSDQQFLMQVGIFNARGERIGSSWTDARPSGENLRVNTRTVLQPLELPGGVFTPPVVVRCTAIYGQNRQLEDIQIHVDGFGMPISLRGECYASGDFPCEWQIGDQSGRFVVPAEGTRALGEVFRPFYSLPGLFVGRTWRVELFNPLAHLSPDLAQGQRFTRSVLVRVTGEETIEHQGRKVEALRVEADPLTAWVAADGRVLRQEVDLPLFGRLTILEEPFDEQAWFNHSQARMRLERRMPRSAR